MQAKIKHSGNNRTLVSVTFQRMEDDGPGIEIEMVYAAYWPEDFTLTSNPLILTPLSVTRTDTRTTVEITPGETRLAMTEAAVELDRYDKSLFK